MHINTGTHGDDKGNLSAKYDRADLNPISFAMDDISSIQELQSDVPVSIHTVTSQAAPYAPVGANMVVNA
eukprot:217599-Hanusia_phi.AAC.1